MRIALLLLTLFVFVSIDVQAQNSLFQFDRILPYGQQSQHNFPTIGWDDQKSADFNGDGLIDILISGVTDSTIWGPFICHLYFNDGQGNFILDTNFSFSHPYIVSFDVADFEGDGDMDIFLAKYIYQPPNQSGWDSVFYLNDGLGQFNPSPLTFPAFGHAKDLDQDGDADFIERTNSDTTYIHENVQGQGFVLRDTIFLPSQSDNAMVDFIDIEGDGDLDIIYNSALFRNMGNFTYQRTLGFFQSGFNQTSSQIQVIDIDQDLDDDVIFNHSSAWLSIFLNQGSGSFTNNNIQSQIDGNFASALEVKDFNNDGNLDLLISKHEFTAPGTVYRKINSQILFGDGNMNFWPDSQNYQFPIHERISGNVYTLDFDNDNDYDIISTGYVEFEGGWIRTGDTLRANSAILLNSGNGTFSYENSELSHEGTAIFSKIDFNLDGFVDLIQRTRGEDLKFFKNMGDGHFRRDTLVSNEVYLRIKGNYPFDPNDILLVKGDYNSDGNDDVLFQNIFTNDLIVIQSDSNRQAHVDIGSFFTITQSDDIRGSTDIDGDGDDDLIAVTGPGGISFYICDGNGGFTPWQHSFPVLLNGEDYFTHADVNGDGLDDIITCDGPSWPNFQINSISLYINNGNGTFSKNTNAFPFSGVYDFRLADLNGDSLLDVVTVPVANSPRVKVYINAGNQQFIQQFNTGFQHESWISLGRDLWDWDIYDFNRDGYLDLIFAENDTGPTINSGLQWWNAYTTNLSRKVYLNDGNARFLPLNEDLTEVYKLSGDNNIVPLKADIIFEDFNMDGLTDYIHAYTDSTYNRETAVYMSAGFPAVSVVSVDTFCSDYQWAQNGIQYTQSGIHYRLDTSSAGNDSLYILDLNIRVIDDSITVQGDSLVALQPSIAYQWLDCSNGFAPIPGATDQIFIPSSSGSYAVSLSSGTCFDTSGCIQVVIGGMDNQHHYYVHLHPNPNNGQFAIDIWDDSQRDFELEVLDLKGNVVYKNRNYLSGSLVSTDNLPPGMYIYLVKGRNWLQRGRLVNK